MNKWIIYKVTSPSGKIYVGQTSKTLQERKYNHEKEAVKKRYQDNAFKRAIRKYGDELQWSIVEENIESLSKSHEREIYWIDKLNSANSDYGYNSTLGGAGVLPTEIVKSKISKSVSKANIKRFKDPEQLKRQRQIQLERVNHPDRIPNLKKVRSSKKSRAKTSKDLIERYKDPEARNTLALALGGQRFKVYKDDKLVGEWTNQAQCAKDLNLATKSHISNCLHKRRKTYKGYSFSFSDD